MRDRFSFNIFMLGMIQRILLGIPTYLFWNRGVVENR